MPVSSSTGEAIGSIKPWGGSAAPASWLECNAQAVSRTTYAALFVVISTTYGVGDGSTTFNVPDFRGRSVIGAGTGSGLTNRARGATGGAESHSLTTAELAAHSHNPVYGNLYTSPSSSVNGSVVGGGTGASVLSDASLAVTATGSSTAHNTMQPFGVAMMIIRA